MSNHYFSWREYTTDRFQISVDQITKIATIADPATKKKLYVPCVHGMDYSHLSGRLLSRGWHRKQDAIDYRDTVMERLLNWPIIPIKKIFNAKADV